MNLTAHITPRPQGILVQASGIGPAVPAPAPSRFGNLVLDAPTPAAAQHNYFIDTTGTVRFFKQNDGREVEITNVEEIRTFLTHLFKLIQTTLPAEGFALGTGA